MTLDQVLGLYNYWIVIFLMMTGFYIVIARENLFKTIIGLNIFQTSVFLLYITMGKVHGGTAPIIQDGGGHDSHSGDEHGAPGGHGVEGAGEHGEHASNHLGELTDPIIAQVSYDEQAVGSVGDAAHHVAEYHGQIYSNPLPSVLMLTAIVVGIATTALALALIVRIREDYGTIEEDEILEMDRNS